MGFCKINNPFLYSITTPKPRFKSNLVTFSSSSLNQNQNQEAVSTGTGVEFKTLGGCKLGISRYPDFEYNAQGGIGKGRDSGLEEEAVVSFDVKSVNIPALTSATTKFLGLPLPPFLRIEIVPELFQGTINKETGKVDLEFKAKFLFTAGTIYKAPPLQVETILTSEESKGTMKSGKGKRLDKEGKCRLVGVATVQPIYDSLMNTFLNLPTECLAELNALISFDHSS